MVTYNIIYSFEVFDKIKEGNKVFVLDRQNKSVALINEMDVQSATKIVNAERNEKRFEFWFEEEREEKEEWETK